MNLSHEPRPHEDELAEDQNSQASDGSSPEGESSDTDPMDDLEDESATQLLMYIDRLQRLQAEFDNFRKRSQQELRDREERTIARVIRQILPVIDDLRHAARAEEQAGEGIGEGLRIILDKVGALLLELSIEEIPAKGEPFDPRWHEAMVHQESDEVSPGAVLTELERGYRLRDTLVRPARVIVAKSPKGE